MLSLAQNIFLLISVLVASLLLTEGLNRIWPVGSRHTQNDLIGWQLSVLGTTYAVILGFMLYTSWTTFTAAELNADLEANALRNIYRLAEGLPPQQREQVEALTRSYVDAVLEKDWPEMARGKVPEASHAVNELMWRTLMSVKAATPSEATAADHALTELSALTLHRRTRLLQSVSQLPDIFWAVLLTGGILTIISVSMFGSANRRLHFLQVFSTTLLVMLALLATADVNQPFQGWVHVDNVAFQRARQNIN
jgi:hypothetical protein